jgi:TPR repeat protein
MNEKNDFALVPRPSSAVEKTAPGVKRVLSGMVFETLAMPKVKALKEFSPNIHSHLEGWYRKGKNYYDGEDVLEDFVEAEKWFRMAAEKGHAKAQYWLGWLYHDGQGGITQDWTEAAKWYREAASQGNADAQYALGICFRHTLSVAETVEWLRKAADQGYTGALLELGRRYYAGDGVSQDRAEAGKWYRKGLKPFHEAAEKGDAEAQYFLGDCAVDDTGELQSSIERVKWYRKAAEQGHFEAQAALAHRYSDGDGVPQDESEAIRWWKKAAENGHVWSRIYLSSRYTDGEGVERDLVEAYKWIRLATDKNGMWERKLNRLRPLLTKEQIAEAEKRYREFHSAKK